MFRFCFVVPLVFISHVVYCEQCQKPELTSTIYTTQDATVLKHIAYIAEFSVKCKKGSPGNLYALFSGSVLPIASIAPNKYQFSWTEDVKTAKIGDIPVKLFDEIGYAALRKHIRLNDDISSVEHFAVIRINHPGSYKGPWISCEFLAAVLSLSIAYYAIHFRTKLIS